MWKSKHGYWYIDGPTGERFHADGRASGVEYDSTTGEKLPPELPPMDWANDVDLPEWTKSIHSALALVEAKLPGWAWHVSKIVDVPTREPLPDCEAQLWLPSASVNPNKLRIAVEKTVGAASTAPRAILIALLRALAQEGQS
jgi:hypothetical protein